MKVTFSIRNFSNIYNIISDVFEFRADLLEEDRMECHIGDSVFIFHKLEVAQKPNRLSEQKNPIIFSVANEGPGLDEVTHRLQLYSYRMKKSLDELGIFIKAESFTIQWHLSHQIVLEISFSKNISDMKDQNDLHRLCTELN